MLSRGVSVGLSMQGLSTLELSSVVLPLCGVIPKWDYPFMGLSVHGGYLCEGLSMHTLPPQSL